MGEAGSGGQARRRDVSLEHGPARQARRGPAGSRKARSGGHEQGMAGGARGDGSRWGVERRGLAGPTRQQQAGHRVAGQARHGSIGEYMAWLRWQDRRGQAATGKRHGRQRQGRRGTSRLGTQGSRLRMAGWERPGLVRRA